MRLRASMFALFCLLLAGEARAQVFSLGIRRAHAFGTQTWSPTLADLNADGKLDVIVANLVADSLTIRLGDGTGNFGPPMRLATGVGPRAVAVADLNGDGLPELVAATSTGVSLFKGLSGGTFSPKFDFPIAGGPEDVAIGDATGDGRPDVVTANPGDNSVTVLTGGPPGVGLNGESMSMSTTAAPSSVALGDLDGNGVLDIVAANHNANVVSVLRGLPAGGFAAKVDYATAPGPGLVEIGALDNDGGLDLVTVSPSPGKLSTLLNNGAGAFPFHDDLTITNTATALVLADFDGDAVPDVAITSNGTTDVTFLKGSGFGTFFGPQGIPTNHGLSHGIGVGDLDHDGWRDVVVTAQDQSVVALLAGHSPFGAHQDYAVGTGPRDVAIAYADGDTLPDLAVANYGSANVSVLLNAGRGTFPAHTEYGTTTYPSLVRFANVSGDARPELLVATYSAFLADTNRVLVLPNLGNGTFGARSQFDLVQDGIAGLATGNFDGDGDIDVVTTHYSNNGARPYFGLGNGGFTPGAPLVTFSGPSEAQLLDVDGNGTLDLMTADAGTGSISVFPGDGAGNFGARVGSPTGAPGASEFAYGDLDGDGRLDLAVNNTTSHAISFLERSGTGVGFLIQTTVPSQTTNGIEVLDVNRDGFPDLVYGSGDLLATRLGQGDGTLGPVLPSPSVGEKFGLALEDLDRNGTVDAAVGLYNAASVAILHGLQSSRTALAVSPSPSPLGATLTLTATITPARPESSVPTGTVRFFDGFTLLGSAPVTDGVATLSYAAALKWDRAFRAEYRGDARFHGSFSTPVPHLTYVPNVGIEPPSAASFGLSLAPARQPSRADDLVLRFTLRSAEPAELALFDVRGRRLVARAVGALGAGAHAANLGANLSPGVYLARLTQGAETVTTRAVVLP
jgi:hypothetical protein